MNFRKIAYTGMAVTAAGLAAVLYSSRDAQDPSTVSKGYNCADGNAMEIYAEVTNRDKGQLRIDRIAEGPVRDSSLLVLNEREYGAPHIDYMVEVLNSGSGLLDSVDFPANFYAPDMKAIDTKKAHVVMPYRSDARYLMLIRPDPIMDKIIATVDLNDYCLD